MKNTGRILIASSLSGVRIAHALASQFEDEFRVIRWTGAPVDPGKPLVHSLFAIAEEIDLAVFVMPPKNIHDHYLDELNLRSNLLFEFGLFVGILGLDRVIIVSSSSPIDTMEIPSDLHGVPVLKYDAASNDADLASNLYFVVSQIKNRARVQIGSKGKTQEYYSCYVSYSSKDKAFVSKLSEDLFSSGVRCWLDEKELKIGESIAGQVSRAIEVHDKVLLVLSSASIRSAWVHREVSSAVAIEAKQKRRVLFPIRIDDSVLEVSGNNEFNILRSRYIGNFTNWQEPNAYRKSFSRLIRDLAISTSVESGGRNDA